MNVHAEPVVLKNPSKCMIWLKRNKLHMDIIKCLFLDDRVSLVNSLHMEMEAFGWKAVVDT